MHELGLSEAIVDAVVERAGGRRVTELRVRVGTAHGVDGTAIQTALDLAAAGTVLQGADVDLILEPMVVRCGSCRHEADAADPLSGVACRRCGGIDVEMIGGDEVVLERIVVEAGG